MVPEKPSNQTQFDLFRLQLDNIINRNHELYRLAKMIDWSVFDESFGSLYCPNVHITQYPEISRAASNQARIWHVDQ